MKAQRHRGVQCRPLLALMLMFQLREARPLAPTDNLDGAVILHQKSWRTTELWPLSVANKSKRLQEVFEIPAFCNALSRPEHPNPLDGWPCTVEMLPCMNESFFV